MNHYHRRLLGALLAVALLAQAACAQDPGGYATAKSALEAARRQGLAAVLEAQLQQARATLAEKTRARNPTGIATYSEAVAILEAAQKEVQSGSDFILPQTRRRPLDPMIEALRTAHAEQWALYQKALSELDARYPPDVRGPTDEPARAPSPEAVSVAVTSVTEQVSTGLVLNLAMPQARPPSDDPSVIAQRGSASVWRAVGHWNAVMNSEDIIRLPVFNQEGLASGAYTNPISRAVSPWRYESLVPILPEPCALRLRQLVTNHPVMLEQWPDSASAQALVFRTRRARWPAAHGFVLEAEDHPGLRQENLITVPISTHPSGARVLVNGVEYKVKGEPLRTPGRVLLPAGSAPEVRLVLAGAKDAVASRFRVVEGARISWRFDLLPTVPDIRLQVDPAREWAATPIVLKPDQRVHFVVEGTWQVGARREPCTFAGYPPGPAFAHYYSNGVAEAAAEPTYPYGALLYRIGERGAVRAVQPGEAGESRLGGALYFDVNERPGRKYRGDNNSKLTVRVRIEG